jgi:hypothetical protein
MADEQKPKAKKTKNPEAKSDAPASPEKGSGKAAGKATSPAAAAEATPPAAPRKSMKPAKLQKKNNSHLPRKLKKAQKKAAAAQTRV